MALHKILVDDFYDDTYILFGIHCNLEDYRIAFLLNKHLNIRLTRLNKDLDFEYVTASYAMYEWEDELQHITWNMVSNMCKTEESSLVSSGSLFTEQTKITKTYNLLPEHKEVNYLLKIDYEAKPVNEKRVLSQLQKVPQIITAYSIDVSQLKSRDNLIFR